MRQLNQGLRSMAWFVMVIGCAASALCQDVQRGEANSNPQSADARLTATAALPDSPGAIWLQSQTPSPHAASTPPTPQSIQPSASSAQTSAPEANGVQEQQDQKLQRPLGTAVAPAPAVSGVTAAQPAGVAIAPARQRRVRTIVLRVGAILGAGAALGTVIALTEATPSKPPGAH